MVANMLGSVCSRSWKGVLLTCSLIGLVGPLIDVAVSSNVTVDGLFRSAAAGLVISNCIGIPATICGFFIWPKLVHASNFRKAAFLALVLGAAAVLGSLSGTIILTATGVFPSGHFWATYKGTLRISLFITFTFGAGSWAIGELRARLQDTTLGLRTNQLERERAEKLAAEARLSSLESRIHPHFLFNALNSIASLVREDPPLAERLIERMAALLRYSLDSAQSSLVPLAQEIDIVEDYLEIEKARFGGRLRYAIEVAGEMDSARVPPMSLQTLVENSLKHAIAPRPEGGTVRVRVFPDRESLVIEVRDDGPGFSLDHALPGHGLDNLRSRLETLFGADARLTVDGSSVLLQVPANHPVAVA
jgi:two-component system, LytTR family, sensor histidine kinase AlgZ